MLPFNYTPIMGTLLSPILISSLNVLPCATSPFILKMEASISSEAFVFIKLQDVTDIYLPNYITS